MQAAEWFVACAHAAPRLEGVPTGYGGDEDGWLAHVGLIEPLGRAFEAQPRECVAQARTENPVRELEDSLRFR